jgi:hypothetical protein
MRAALITITAGILGTAACAGFGVGTPIGTVYGRPAGSGGGDTGGSVTVMQPPEVAARTTAEVFRRAGIPVAEVEGAVVRSGVFQVERRWGTDPIERRITCGEGSESLLRYSAVELQVDAYAAPETVRPGGSGREPQQRTNVRIESEGQTLDTRIRCWLTAAFMQELLNAIGNAAGRPGRIVTGANGASSDGVFHR